VNRQLDFVIIWTGSWSRTCFW